MASTRYLDVESLGRLCRVHSRFAANRYFERWSASPENVLAILVPKLDQIHLPMDYGPRPCKNRIRKLKISASRPTKFRRAFTLNRPARGCRLMRLKTGGIDIQVGITENGIIQHIDGIQPEFELFGLRNPDPLDTGR